MLFADKAELGALYINAQEAVFIQHILQELGYPHMQMPIQTDDSMAKWVANIKFSLQRE